MAIWDNIEALLLSENFDNRNVAYSLIESQHKLFPKSNRIKLAALISGFLINEMYNDEEDEYFLLVNARQLLVEIVGT